MDSDDDVPADFCWDELDQVVNQYHSTKQVQSPIPVLIPSISHLIFLETCLRDGSCVLLVMKLNTPQ